MRTFSFFGWSIPSNSNQAGITSASQWHRCFIQLQYLKENVSGNLIIQAICFVLPNNSRDNWSSVKVMKTWQVSAAYMLICPSFAPGTSPWTLRVIRMTNTLSKLENDLTVCESQSFIFVWNRTHLHYAHCSGIMVTNSDHRLFHKENLDEMKMWNCLLFVCWGRASPLRFKLTFSQVRLRIWLSVRAVPA